MTTHDPKDSWPLLLFLKHLDAPNSSGSHVVNSFWIGAIMTDALPYSYGSDLIHLPP